MIYEFARLTIKQGADAAFEQGVREAIPLFERARGCRSVQLLRSVEQAMCYTLMVTWDTLEDHTVHFRGSEDFQQWRRLVSDHLASPPEVEHHRVAVACT